MRNYVLMVVVFCLPGVLFAQVPNDREAIERTVQLNIDGALKYDDARLRRAFHPDAHLEADLVASEDIERLISADDTLVRRAVQNIKEHGAAVIPNLSFIAMTRAQLDDMENVLRNPEAKFLAADVLNMWKNQNPTKRSELKRFDLRERGKYQIVRLLTRVLNDAEVPLFLGTDASAPGMYPGKSAHLELSELVAAGFTPTTLWRQVQGIRDGT